MGILYVQVYLHGDKGLHLFGFGYIDILFSLTKVHACVYNAAKYQVARCNSIYRMQICVGVDHNINWN